MSGFSTLDKIKYLIDNGWQVRIGWYKYSYSFKNDPDHSNRTKLWTWRQKPCLLINNPIGNPITKVNNSRHYRVRVNKKTILLDKFDTEAFQNWIVNTYNPEITLDKTQLAYRDYANKTGRKYR